LYALLLPTPAPENPALGPAPASDFQSFRLNACAKTNLGKTACVPEVGGTMITPCPGMVLLLVLKESGGEEDP